MIKTIKWLSEQADQKYCIVKSGVKEWITVNHLFGDNYEVKFYNSWSHSVVKFNESGNFKLRVQR